MRVDILSWYLKHKSNLIGSNLYESGRRLQFDWQLSNSYINSSCNRSISNSDKISSTINRANTKAEYSMKVNNALSFVGSPSLDEILVSVICKGLSMKVFENNNNWRPGVGGYVLKIALSRLMQYYEKFDAINP